MELFEKAQLYFDEGKYVEAKNLARFYLDISSSHEPEEPEKRSQAYVLIGHYFDDLGRIPEAIEHYRLAVKENPQNARALLYLGHALLEKGQDEEGISHIEESIKKDPSMERTLEEMLVTPVATALGEALPLIDSPKSLREKVMKMVEEYKRS